MTRRTSLPPEQQSQVPLRPSGSAPDSSARHEPLLQLQQTAGNRAVTELVEAQEPAQEVPARDPLDLDGAVGERGENCAADLAKVQRRLVEVGALQESDVIAAAPDSCVDASALAATIKAIRSVQRTLFDRDNVDGTIDPLGRTWSRLRTLDAATLASIAAERVARKQKKKENALALEAEKKQVAAARLEQWNTSFAERLLAKYAVYLPFATDYVSLDESGLAAALAPFVKSNPGLLAKVFERLDDSDTDDVAYELAAGASDAELAGFDRGVLETMQRAMSGGVRTSGEAGQIARLARALNPEMSAKSTGVEKSKSAAGGEVVAPPVIEGETLADRIRFIHEQYDRYFVTRATTNNCHAATKAALNKMGWDIGGAGSAFLQKDLADEGLSKEQSAALLAGLLAEVQAGRPVAIGIDYQAGSSSPRTLAIVDHWLYIVAVTVDDGGAMVLVAYENVDVTSTITDGNIIVFRIDEVGRIHHGAFREESKNKFSNTPHVVVNFKPVHRIAKP